MVDSEVANRLTHLTQSWEFIGITDGRKERQSRSAKQPGNACQSQKARIAA
jgi:hypothetical protein